MKNTLSPSKILFGFLVTTTIALSASASPAGGLFIEPGITYQSNDTATDLPAPYSNSSGTATGYGLEAKIGGHVAEAIFLAADIRYLQPKFKDSHNNLDSTAVETNYAALLGIQMPIVGLRVWADYVFGGEFRSGQSNGVDFKSTNATGYRVGAGFRILALSLNLEYQDLRYRDTDLKQAGPFAGTQGNSALTERGYIASVSFPLEL